jgi:hypothetical protein
MDGNSSELSEFFEELWNENDIYRKTMAVKEMIPLPGIILPEHGIKHGITG